MKLNQNTNAITVAAENAASNVTPNGGSYARGTDDTLAYGDDI